MKDLNEYIKKTRISDRLESKITSYIERHVKINPLGVIDWHESAYSVMVEKIEKNNLIPQLFSILEKINSNPDDVYFILQVDDLFPPLQSRFDCWVNHCADNLYPDTIFLSTNGQHIIHYDFYGSLWGKSIPMDSPQKNMKIIEELME